MTVPPQRDEPSVSTLILGGVQELKSSLDRLTARFDALDQKFMPRDQVVDRFATVTQAQADQRAALDAAKTAHDTDVQRIEDRLTASRRFALTLAVSVAVLFVAVVGTIATIAYYLNH